MGNHQGVRGYPPGGSSEEMAKKVRPPDFRHQGVAGYSIPELVYKPYILRTSTPNGAAKQGIYPQWRLPLIDLRRRRPDHFE